MQIYGDLQIMCICVYMCGLFFLRKEGKFFVFILHTTVFKTLSDAKPQITTSFNIIWCSTRKECFHFLCHTENLFGI